MVDGRLAFQPTGTDIWGDPDCVRTIDVMALDAESQGAERWQWKQGSISGPCRNPFPIIYGATFVAVAGGTDSMEPVPAKPLMPNITYEVSILSPGSAYGGGRFRLDGQGQVENLH